MNTIWFSLILIGVVSSSASADKAHRTIGKCLFIGDSITLHAPNERLGWEGDWGMDASSQDKDFVHQVHQYLCDIQKDNPPELLISGRDTGQAGRISNALNVIDELTAIQADFIVIQLGENEKVDEATRENFLVKYDQLVACLRKTSPEALIVCTGVWTPKCENPRKSLKEDFIKEVCEKYACVFVDIVPVASRPKNAAWADKRHANYGVGWHPGDGGMKGYAEEIIAAIKPYLFSQPIQSAEPLTGIIPEPQRVYTFTDKREGYQLVKESVIVLRKEASDLEVKAAEIIKDEIQKTTGIQLPVLQKTFPGQKPALVITTERDFDRVWQERPWIVKELSAKGPESVQVSSYSDGIIVESVSPNGIFSGAQSLRQLLSDEGGVPPILIADYRREPLQ